MNRHAPGPSAWLALALILIACGPAGSSDPASGAEWNAAATAGGHYQMENLNRGVVAVKVSNGIYVGWRMFGYEYDPANPSAVSYDV